MAFELSQASKSVRELANREEEEITGWEPLSGGGVRLQGASGDHYDYSASDIAEAEKYTEGYVPPSNAGRFA